MERVDAFLEDVKLATAEHQQLVDKRFSSTTTMLDFSVAVANEDPDSHDGRILVGKIGEVFSKLEKTQPDLIFQWSQKYISRFRAVWLFVRTRVIPQHMILGQHKAEFECKKCLFRSCCQKSLTFHECPERPDVNYWRVRHDYAYSLHEGCDVVIGKQPYNVQRKCKGGGVPPPR